MMTQITEEQAINGALNICTQGGMAVTRFAGWFLRAPGNMIRMTGSIINYTGKITEKIEELKGRSEKGLLEDACSYYRGGFVKNGAEPKMQELIADLRGTEFTRADGNFIFLGDKSDLSYFWKKNENNEPLVLLRSYVDSIEDPGIKRGTISALTQAKERGFLTFDGEAYALTKKGKEAVLDPGFIANRLKGEEVFFERAWQSMRENLPKLYVFEEAGKEPTEYYLLGTVKGADGQDFMKLMSEDKQELILPNEAKGKIAFESKEEGEKFVKENAEKVAELQEYVKTYKAEKNKELYPAESYKNSYEETEGGYLVTLNNGNKIELPREDVTKLEDGSIKADIYYDKEYTLYIKDQKTTINGDGVKGELTKNATKTTAGTTKQTAEAAKQTVEAAKQTVETAKQAGETVKQGAETVKQGADAVKQTVDTGVQATVAVADVATTAAPPVKVAEEVVKTVGEVATITEKAVETTAKVGESAFKGGDALITFASDPAQNLAETGTKLAETGGKLVEGVSTAVDGAATLFPPAKIVTTPVNIIYKTVSSTASGTVNAVKGMNKSVQKL